MMMKYLTKKASYVFLGMVAASSLLFAEEDNLLMQLESKTHIENVDSIVAQSKKRKKSTTQTAPRREVVNSWKPMWIGNRYIDPVTKFTFRADVGCGFLYFSNIRLNLAQTNATGSGNNSLTSLRNKMGYNRTPVFEAILGMKANRMLSLGLAYLHQGGVNVQSHTQYYGGANSYKLSANLALDAILAKAYFNVPGSVVWKTIAYNTYLGGGVGAGWQTWSQVRNIVSTNNDISVAPSNYPFKQKICANLVWQGDVGVKLRSVIPNINFSVMMGAKVIGWGQARNVGDITQQKGTTTYGLVNPLNIKFLFSIAPYMGVNWAF